MSAVLNVHLLVSPLYDIQAKIEQIRSKYGDKVYIEALRDDVMLPEGAAPKAAVYNFLSVLTERLFEYRQIERVLQNEHERRKRNVNVYMAVSLIVLISAPIVSTIAFYGHVRRVLEENIPFEIIETLYFIFMVIFVMVMGIALTVMLRNKQMAVYDNVFGIKKLFASEPAIEHILKMLEVTDINQNTIKARGCNPLLGLFLKRHRPQKVRYKFVPDSWPSGQTVEDECSDQSKTFTFDESSQMTKLTEADNIACNLITKGPNGESWHAVDPLVPGTVFESPAVLLKKIQKYDVFRQYDILIDAVLYFKQILMGNGTNSMITGRDKNSVQNMIRNSLTKQLDETITGTILTQDLSLPSSARAQAAQTLTNISTYEDFVSQVAPMTNVICAYYDPSALKAYLFQGDTPTFVYSPSGTGNKPMLLTRARASGTLMKIGAAEVDTTDEFRPVNTMPSELGNSIYLTKNNNPKYMSTSDEVSYRDVLTADTAGSTKWKFLCTVGRYAKMNEDASNLSNTFLLLKPVLTRMIKEEFSSTGMQADLEFIVAHLRQYYGSQNYKYISSMIADVINEASMSEKEGAEEDDNTKYVSYQAFMTMISNMSTHDFVEVFMRKLDELRYAATSLNQINMRFSTYYEIQQRNQGIYDAAFVFITLVAAFELIRFGANRVIWFMCYRIELSSEKELIREQFSVNADQPPKIREFNTGMQSLKIGEIESKERDYFANALFMYLMVASGIILGIGFMFAWRRRQTRKSQHNHYVSQQNGITIVNKANGLYMFFIEQISRNGIFIKPNAGFSDTGDMDRSYEQLLHNVTVDKDTSVSVPDSANLKIQFEDLKHVVSAFDECNSLIDSRIQRVPFPTFEFMLYLLILAVVVTMALYTYFKMRPIERLRNLSVWRRIEELHEIGVEVDPQSYGFECHDPQLLQSKKQATRVAMIIIGVTTLVLTIIFVIILGKQSGSMVFSPDCL